MFNKRNIIILILILAVAVGGVLIWNWKFSGPQSHQVQAQFTGPTSDGFNVLGTHVFDYNPESSDLTHQAAIKVKVDANTKFVRTVWLAPTEDDFSNYQPPFYARQSDNPQQGSASDLKNQLGILLVIKTVSNSSNKNEITALEVDYSLPTSQTGFGFSGQITKDDGNTVSASGLFFVQNSPGIFMNQVPSAIKLVISPDTKLFKIVIPRINPANSNSKTAGLPSAPVQVTASQLKTDFATYKKISMNALSPVSVYGLASFTPRLVYYSVFSPAK